MMQPLHKKIVIDWEDEAKKNSLYQTFANPSFLQLAQNFQPQINPYFCGIASACIVLNAITKNNQIKNHCKNSVLKNSHLSFSESGYPLLTQLSLLNSETDQIKTMKEICGYHLTETPIFVPHNPGLSLKQLELILKTYQVDVQAFYANQKNWCSDLRNHLEDAFQDGNSFIIANFYGRYFGKSIGGHFSPIGAHDAETDSILIMDVAAHKTGWYWVSLIDLIISMSFTDDADSRGYLVVRKN